MYGAIKGRFNLDFGFPLCFDLDWFAEREWLQPGSAVMAATRSQVLYTALYKVHYTPLQGQKKSWGGDKGDRGGGME